MAQGQRRDGITSESAVGTVERHGRAIVTKSEKNVMNVFSLDIASRIQ